MVIAGAPTNDATTVAPGFRPTLVTDVELSQPLPAIAVGDTGSGTAFQRALVVARLHGQPLGAVEVDLELPTLPPARLAAALWSDLGAAINEHLREDGLAAVAGLAAGGIELDGRPRCLAEREAFLATAPHVGVVVATRDRPDSLLRCLRSLERLDYPRFEVVVVDNAPRGPATADLLAVRPVRLPVHYVREDRPGLAAAHNRGVRALGDRCAVVAFTDDDVIVDPLWLTELVRGFEAGPNVGCVTGMIVPAELATPAQALIEEFGGFNKGFRRRMFRLAHPPADPLFPYAPGRFGSGANMAFRLDALRRIGGFDPAMGTGTPALGGDDLASFFDVIEAGYALVYEPAAIVFHRHYRDDAALRRQIWGYGVGLTAFLTRAVAVRPARVVDLARKAPRGVWYALSPRSAKNRHKRADYPAALTWLERRGMLYGPIAYLRGRLAARRYARRRSPQGPHQDQGDVVMIPVPNDAARRLAAARRWARATILADVTHWLRSGRHRLVPPRVGTVDFGDLRRLTPVSRGFGFDRGRPVDRVYVEEFLARHADDIRGHVLEVGDDGYTRRFGGARVTATDILDVSPANRRATIVGDLAASGTLPADRFDCIVLTQTLQLVYDLQSAVAALARALKPGGVLLLTVPGISQLDDPEWSDSWYWMFTARAIRRLLSEVFPADRIAVEARGNVLAAVAFLHGLGAEELTMAELAACDPAYELVIAARAVKPHPGGDG